MVCSMKRACGAANSPYAAASCQSAKERKQARRTLNSILAECYEETRLVVDRGRCRAGAIAVFDRRPPAHARRPECRGILVPGREAADFSNHEPPVPVRPDVHHECRWVEPALGLD